MIHLTEIITGLFLYLLWVIPMSIIVLHKLIFHGIDDAFDQIFEFYSYCWPTAFDRDDVRS